MNDRVEQNEKASPGFEPLAVQLIAMLGVACSPASEETEQAAAVSNAHVDPSHFIPETLVGEIVQEERTLADGTRALSYVIRTYSEPHEHPMGPVVTKNDQ